MIIEKLAQFKSPPPDIYLKLLQTWQVQGFEIVERQDKKRIIHCSGRSYSRIRVDILTECFDWEDQILVQIIYSPRLTPAVSRPVNISPVGREKIRGDLEGKMISVLDQVGEWAPLSRLNVESAGMVLPDLYRVSVRSKGTSGRMRVFIGLVLALLGALMGYLNLNDILTLGSSELWLLIAVAGVFGFCLGLYNWLWGR